MDRSETLVVKRDRLAANAEHAVNQQQEESDQDDRRRDHRVGVDPSPEGRRFSIQLGQKIGGLRCDAPHQRLGEEIREAERCDRREAGSRRR